MYYSRKIPTPFQNKSRSTEQVSSVPLTAQEKLPEPTLQKKGCRPSPAILLFFSIFTAQKKDG